ncbi:hypothetical protein BGZ81_002522 [Podila clonocystis]|nr:hypothetical protein BGZ81_002522 [Podila clonocystis]
MRLSEERTMSTRTHPTSSSSSRTRSRTTSMAWSILSLLVLTLSLTTYTDAALTPGFCGDCQTFSNAIGVCGGTFSKTDIEIQTAYALPQAYAKCVCTETMQKVLWTCKRCEELAGFKVTTPPPNSYRSTCIGWGISAADYTAPYTGVVAPGTQGIDGASPNPPNTSGGGTNPTGGNGGTTSSGTPGQPTPSGDGSSPSGNDGGGGVSGAAVGISLGIIGIAAVGGGAAMFMMKRRRHDRHAPLELGDNYVGLEDNWEKPARPSSPPMAPAPVASGAPLASRGPMQGRPSPFETRPGGGGSVVGGYDGQYDQYDHYHHGGSQVGGYNDGYNQGGQYDQNYYQGHGQQGYGQTGYPPHHDYGYENTVPTSGPGGYPPHPSANGGDGKYM